ncbi:hypothetical protein [Gramella sp. KN1008]|uniref:hypothetical protein n=1 Tax=Gramella sp. KN1008 TaxID=2529298 RepID=UPI00104049DC|nr:hypothetical protein [Gramella sp. KN1008]TBW27990.1 hypothetical protein EZJ28_09660 [Gramella sp. KN1008]
MRMLKRHTNIALIYFFLIAFLGVMLRIFPIVDMPVNYRFIVHTHSHIALLGWVYTGLTTLIYFAFLKSAAVRKRYRIIFWFTQITIIGMLVTFPFTGYALFSIIFSSLFLLASYWFVYFFFKHCPATLKKKPSYKLVKISLWYMVISSLGPWALGAIMNTAGSGSPWYRNAIYFFLHFQYNGWFIVALCGIFLFVFEQKSYTLSRKVFTPFYYLLNGGVVLTFFLSLLWMHPNWSFYLLALLGGVMQLISFGMLFRAVYARAMSIFKEMSSLVKTSVWMAILFLFVKLCAQILGSFPVISDTVFTNLDMIISYIHWVFLGLVSVLLMAFLYQFQLMKLSLSRLYFYIAGFFLTELLIFSRGMAAIAGIEMTSYLHLLIGIASLWLLIAIALILAGQLSLKD